MSDTAVPRRHGPRRARDGGFTLVEILISLVLSGMIAGVTVSVMLTSMNAVESTSQLIADSTDAGLISTYLIRDAQSAGGINPMTATRSADLGISVDSSPAGWGNCQQPGKLVARFSWVDRTATSAGANVVVTWALDGAKQLVRRACQNGSTVDLILGKAIDAATTTCTPNVTCAGDPTSVSLAISGSATRAPFKYTLTASVRGDVQVAPAIANSAPLPLVLLGDATGASPCPRLTLGLAGIVAVRGDVLVNGSCGAGPIAGDQSKLRQTGAANIANMVNDPYAARLSRQATCPDGATNPTPIGASSGPSAVTIYPAAVTITSNTNFAAGQHLFCAGLTFGPGARITGTGVVFDIVGGTLIVDDQASVDVSAATTGDYASIVIWVETKQTVTISSGTRVNSFRGTIYAPASLTNLTAAVGTNIGGIVTNTINVQGGGSVRIGNTIPVLTLSAPSMPLGEVGVTYPATPLVISGGASPYVWSAAGLPPGMSISTNGVLSGNPTAAGSFTVIASALDSTTAGGSIELALTVNPALVFDGSTPLPGGQVAVAYPTTSMTSSGGTAPYVWSASGLPAGLTMTAAGVLTGTPRISGTFPVTVTVTDAQSATSSQKYTLNINPPLAITGPVTLPNGQVGLTYSTTTATSSGGTAPFAWSATGLPAGLSIASTTGTISGAPTVAGVYSVVVNVTDQVGASASISYNLTVNAALAVAGPTSLPNGQVSVSYANTSITASGGTTPFSWSAAGLPSGLTLSAGGALTGTPTIAGTFTVTVTVTDAMSAKASRTYALTIKAALAVVGPATLPTGQVGASYANTTMTSSGGTAPYSWSASGLPAGLALDAATGTISGTPTVAGSVDVVVTVTDQQGATAGVSYKVVVTGTPTVTLDPVTDPARGTITLSATATTPSGTITSVKFQYAVADSAVYTDICTDTTAPYSCSWDTTKVATTVWDVRALLTTSTGATATNVVASMQVDNVAPTVSLADPGSPMSGTVTLTATATDADSGVSSVVIQYAPTGTTTWTSICTAPNTTYACRFDTTALPKASYDLQAVATDYAGNTSTSIVTKRLIDNSVPAVSLDDPGTYLRGTVPITAVASAPTGVAMVVVQYAPTGKGTWATICTPITSPYQCIWDTTKVATATYDLRAVMTDKAGVITTSVVLVGRVIDNSTVRGVDVQAPAAGTTGRIGVGDTISYTYSTTMDLTTIKSGWSGDLTTVVVRVRDGKAAKTGGPKDDVFDIFTTSAYSSPVNIGTVLLNWDYVKTNKTVGFNATMVATTETVGGISWTKISITITELLSTDSLVTSKTPTSMVWNPSVLAKDLRKTASSATPVTQSGSRMINF